MQIVQSPGDILGIESSLAYPPVGQNKDLFEVEKSTLSRDAQIISVLATFEIRNSDQSGVITAETPENGRVLYKKLIGAHRNRVFEDSSSYQLGRSTCGAF